jgi:MFS family permease
MLLVLTALSAMNQLDRQLVNILIEPIRAEYSLSDIQIGLLSGLAFAAIYGVLSIPAALYAVRHNRRNLLALSAAVWGGMTVMCGLVQSYSQLLVARLGVGIGEAGGMPPSHAMISDRYGPNERAAAMATWASGVNIGIFLAFLCGGLIGELYGWRVAFFWAGGLTVALAIVVQLTVREPERTTDIAGSSAQPTVRLLSNLLRAIGGDPVLRHVIVGATLASVVGYSFLTWLSSFLVRSHGFGIGEAGMYIAVVVGALGAGGTWLGGHLTERLQRRDIRWALWLTAVAMAGIAPFTLAALLAAPTWIALTLFAVQGTFGAVFIGPSIAILHNRVPDEARPVASAVFLLVVNCVGLACGPLGVGALSQYVFAAYGTDSLRYALATIEILAVLSSVHYFVAGVRLRVT